MSATQPRHYTIPLIDLAHETDRQVVVDREPGQYLGHPTTVLLEDNRTMITVYPKGHGRGAIVMKRSADAGLTWSDRLPVPENWATSLEVPTLYRVVDRQGVRRLIMFSGLYPVRMAVSEDDGATWTPLAPIGDFGGVVAMASLVRLANGDYMTLFHDDGRFLRGSGERSGVWNVYKSVSRDGGLTWAEPEVIATHPEAHICEPGAVRSPDGRQIAVLLRENSRRFNSMVIFSDDEGLTWTDPVEVAAALTGDRHAALYAPDGRLVITFRDTTHVSPTHGDWVAWVGTYEHIVAGREGQYRVRLMDNKVGGDCAYPGLEVLPDGTFVSTTYGHWVDGESPFIMSVRFKLDEIDARAAALPAQPAPEMVDVFVSGAGGYPCFRIPSVVVTNAGAVLALCEGRQTRSDHARNDIVLRRSTDAGRTWSPLQVVADEGGDSLNDPSAVVDRATGRVVLHYSRFAEGYHTDKAVPGYDDPHSSRNYVVWSDDDGKTWSEPLDVTRQIKRPHVRAAVVTCGIGTQLRRDPYAGRLVHAVYQFGDGPLRESYVCFSDDGGRTWRIGAPAALGEDMRAGEPQVVELADGAILMNARTGMLRRKVAVSKDGGESFSEMAPDPVLIEPACQASILRLTDPLDGRPSRILFSNPASETARLNGTVRLSYDECARWSVAKTLYAGPFAYSCLTALPDGAIGCLFEKDDYAIITLARFTLPWLTDGIDRLASP